MAATCKTCKFFKKDKASREVNPLGACKRFPPSVVSTESEPQGEDLRPVVRSWDWCGEYRLKLWVNPFV